MSGAELVIIGVIGFILSILSGIAGGGGGFIMTPLLIFFGLTPSQSIATGKLAGLAMAVGSLTGMKAKGKLDKKLTIIITLLSIIAGVISARVIVGIDDEAYSVFIGLVLILIAPLMYFKKLGHTQKEVSITRKGIGYIGIFVFLLLQGIFSSGMGVLVSLAMMSGLGLTAIKTNIIRRTTQVVLNVVIIFSLIGSGLILWNVAAVLIVVNLVGSAIGGRIAIKRGNAFVSYVLAGLSLVSGIAILLS